MSNKKNNGALERVLLRNAFYHDSFRRAGVALLFLIVVNCLLAGAIVYKIISPPQPQYFAASADGRLINWHPLSDPAVPENYVTQWAANAVQQSFSFDFMHWRHQLQKASSNFTDYGWKTFMAALQKSNNLTTLTQLKMVSDVTLTGAPKILQEEVINGRYAWKIQMPILVTFTNAGRTIPMPMDITLIVMRVPVQDNPNRIAINNFLPVPTDNAAQQLIGG
jgi:intracellular multiplication protein IcmL